MKNQRVQKRVKQCVDLVKLIKNRPRHQPYHYQRSGNAGRSHKNENNSFFYNATGNYDHSCIFNCRNAHPPAHEANHSSFHINNCDPQNQSGCSSVEETNRKSSEHTLFMAESQLTVLSYGLVNDLNKLSNTTPNTNTLQQEEHENTTPSCSNKSKSEIEKSTNDATPINKVSLSESVAELNETISREANNVENTLNARQSALQHEATTTVAENTVSRQMLADEEAGGDGHHNNSIIEIEITLLSDNDTNSEEEDEGDEETPMPEENGE